MQDKIQRECQSWASNSCSDDEDTMMEKQLKVPMKSYFSHICEILNLNHKSILPDNQLYHRIHHLHHLFRLYLGPDTFPSGTCNYCPCSGLSGSSSLHTVLVHQFHIFESYNHTLTSRVGLKFDGQGNKHRNRLGFDTRRIHSLLLQLQF